MSASRLENNSSATIGLDIAVYACAVRMPTTGRIDVCNLKASVAGQPNEVSAGISWMFVKRNQDVESVRAGVRC